ncbi:MAG: hypothetical protein BHW64_05470 [Candidatus Melainabacteria bacterium LEY3_CP_29_8]|nr:MAG: hypothetical protein BHW64_05470 [Candidatus Melainabacteria bacterium LEY3_CP_29_8]
MNRKTIIKQNNKIKFSLKTCVFILWSIFLIIIATFTQITLTKLGLPTFILKHIMTVNYESCYKYIPQIPVVLFVASLLGRKYSFIAISLYIILGLFFIPIFALGGGLNYMFKYTFGFIIAYIPSAFIISTILCKYNNLKSYIQSAVIGVLIIHIIGIIYMITVLMFKHEAFNYITSWLSTSSGTKIFYDIIFSFIAVIIGKTIKKLYLEK